MIETDISEPTSEQCSNHEKVFEDDARVGYAIWYPQMGGYGGRAVALLDKEWFVYPNGGAEGGCVDILVWHDGELPFSGGTPRAIHHCDPEQFVEFGRALSILNERGRRESE